LQEDEQQIPIWSQEEQPDSGKRAYSQDELAVCESCKRANPPTRTSCIYCGATLPINHETASLIKPTLRPLENWEQGFSVVILPDRNEATVLALKMLSDLLRIEIESLRIAIASGRVVPLARCASQEEAELVCKRLIDLGIRAEVVSDIELDANPVRRVRTLELTDNALFIYPTGRDERHSLQWQDISLLVIGRRIVRRLEVAERPDKKRGKEVIDSRELSSDSERLDIYTTHDEPGWRVAAENFDFSCLGKMKTLIASQNFQELVAVLRKQAPFAVYTDSYVRLRQTLGLVWPLNERTESLGLGTSRIGRVSTGAVTTSDNELQFTRYSRLMHIIKQSHSELIV